LVKNGDTIVLGGVYEDNQGVTIDKVPFFGDLPFIGSLFRRNSTFNDKTELLIFLTPKILSDPLTARK
jgi:type IV pilus assembly protein PilQ